MTILFILYLLISLVFFGWTLILSLKVGMWLFLIYLVFGIFCAVFGIGTRHRRKKALKRTFLILMAFPVLVGIFVIAKSILTVAGIYILSVIGLLFNH